MAGKTEMKTPMELKAWFSSEEFNRNYEYAGKDLGAVCEADKTVFKVWAPTASMVILNLFGMGSKYEGDAAGDEVPTFLTDCVGRYVMESGKSGVWQKTFKQSLDGIYYTFSVTVDGKTEETADPYARACGVNGQRSMVVNLPLTDPQGWEDDGRPEGIYRHPSIYELHIKDFSHSSFSGIPEKLRGKYPAFTVDGTCTEGSGFSTCMDYLKSLGVTYVHILPTYDYGSVDESRPELDGFNWGYDPVNYNVPEGSYATDPYDGHVRIKEFKQMVMALHKAGMGVIMDVVYNHTYNMEVPLAKTVPGYYYRMFEDGTYANGSACGNDTASERAMFRRYMVDSVCYWAKEYHIDGFRFDLMGLHDVETMNEIRQRLDELPGGKHILMYGEPWSAAKTAWENDAVGAVMANIHLLDPRIAVFCDRTRDGVKGDVFIEEEPGYVNAPEDKVMEFKSDIRSAVCGWCDDRVSGQKLKPLAPAQMINYVSAHDDLTLWDKLVISVKEKPDFHEKYPDILQMNRMAAGIVFTCMGTPFFQAGEEFGRTKDGCDNSFNKSADLNELDWRRAEEFAELTDYYRFLIKLRRQLPVIEERERSGAQKPVFAQRADAVIGFLLPGEDKEAVIFYNPYNKEKEAVLPDGEWQLYSDGVSRHALNGMETVKDSITLKGKSVTVLGRTK